MSPRTPLVDGDRLRRVQAGARATLALGIGASLTANMLAAHPSLIGRLVAGWSPVALMLTVELLSRVPTSNTGLSRLRVVTAGTIAGIAAWVSYWHMVQVSLDAGEAPIAAHLLPLSVDGLVIVASICLVEITNRLNHSTPPTTRRSALSTAQRTAQTTTPTAVTARPPAAAEPDRAGAAGGGAGGSVVGDRVRQLAAEHPGWTQVELAEAAGCSVRTVRRHLTTPRPGTTELHEAPAVTPPSSAIDQLASTGATHNGSTP